MKNRMICWKVSLLLLPFGFSIKAQNLEWKRSRGGTGEERNKRGGEEEWEEWLTSRREMGGAEEERIGRSKGE
ncbi:hypothetical protein FQA47_023358 [Oryzias melastigma]|uniref:Uncharacterized protein n=1 Tax=Oryzias melastigma TaxID=30732 RepID=A0A834CI32_ORYME|nr:hypothetical protein FQA47_023358 [Oryzias melastigma]